MQLPSDKRARTAIRQEGIAPLVTGWMMCDKGSSSDGGQDYPKEGMTVTEGKTAAGFTCAPRRATR